LVPGISARIGDSDQLSAVSFQRSVVRGERLKDFRKLKVWEKSHLLTLEVYKATAAFQREEMYGLTSQMRRASTSIPSNIAEGCGRDGAPELARFLRIAMGSASELEYQLLLGRDIGFLRDEYYQTLSNSVVEIKRMLTGLIQKLKADS
jgi:four helix bundle protein